MGNEFLIVCCSNRNIYSYSTDRCKLHLYITILIFGEKYNANTQITMRKFFKFLEKKKFCIFVVRNQNKNMKYTDVRLSTGTPAFENFLCFAVRVFKLFFLFYEK